MTSDLAPLTLTPPRLVREAPVRIRPRTLHRRGVVSSVLLGAILAAAYGGAWRPDLWWELAICSLALLAAAFVSLAGWAEATRSWPALVFLTPAGIGCVQLMMGTTVSTASTEARVIRWAAAAAVCVLGSVAVRSSRPGRFLDAIAAGGAVLATLAALQAHTSGGSVFWWIHTPLASVFGPFLNRNHFAAFCELLFPLAAWRAVDRPGWRRWAPAALALAGLMSGSRAGVALLTLEVAVVVLWAVSPRAGLSRLRSLRWMITALAGIPLVALALGGDALLERLRESEPLLYRDQIWGSALELIRQRPLSGHGLGAFATAYPAVARFDTGEIVHRAHSDWLEWWVEGGAVVPLTWAALLFWCVRKTMSTPWLAGVPAILLHSAVDYPLDRLLLLLLVGFLVTMGAGTPAPQKRIKKPLPGV